MKRSCQSGRAFFSRFLRKHKYQKITDEEEFDDIDAENPDSPERSPLADGSRMKYRTVALPQSQSKPQEVEGDSMRPDKPSLNEKPPATSARQRSRVREVFESCVGKRIRRGAICEQLERNIITSCNGMTLRQYRKFLTVNELLHDYQMV